MFSHVCERWLVLGSDLLVVAAMSLFLGAPAHAQAMSASSRHDDLLTITRIDPPNWYAALPKPMLLIQGRGLRGAEFSLSDPNLHIERTQISGNGHWAQLWLSASPAAPETVQLQARRGSAHVARPYRFDQRRAAGSGMAGLSSRDVLYLILPDRFADGDLTNDRIAGSPAANRRDPHAYHGGDLKGVVDHLDYLQQLGVTAVWLTPVLQNNPITSDYHGYGATDMYAIEPRLGTLAEYRHLADELHRRHMKLVFDDVPNHVGPGNLWVIDPPTPGWFHGTAAHHLDNRYDFPPVTDPHASPAASLDAEDGWFVNLLPDLNQQNPVVAQYLTENMIWWIEQAGIDGLRIDTFPYVQREFWQQYLSTLTTLYPRLTSIGEVTTGDPTVNAYFAGGRKLGGVDTHLTTPFDYPMYYALLDVLVRGKPMSQLEETLRKDWLYPHPEALVPFISNHDQPRFLSQPGATPALLRLGLGLVLTLRGMPELYAGDEIEMRGGEDPDNRRDFPGGFPGDAANAFTVAGRSTEQNSMHDWIAALGSLRSQSAALQSGMMQTLVSGTSTFAYVRTLAARNACSVGGAMLIVVNRDASPSSIEVPVANTALAGCHALIPTLGDRQPTDQPITGTTVTVKLPAFGFEVFKLR